MMARGDWGCELLRWLVGSCLDGGSGGELPSVCNTVAVDTQYDEDKLTSLAVVCKNFLE